MALLARNTAFASGRAGAPRAAVPRAVRSRIALRRPAVVVRAEETDDAKVLPLEKTGPNFTALKDINTIMATLPHR